MASSKLSFSPTEAMTIFILTLLKEGCEHDILANLLDMSSHDVANLITGLIDKGIFEEKDKAKPRLRENDQLGGFIQNYITENYNEQHFHQESLSSAVYAYIEHKSNIFLERMLYFIEKFENLNLPIHLYYTYTVFSECFKHITFETEDKKFCYQAVNICILIQEIIHLYPYNSDIELLTSLKIRDLAFAIGDQRSVSYGDLQIGAMNLNLRVVNKQSDYFLNMKSAKDAIFSFGDNDIIVRCSPMIIFYYYINGDYDEAINIFYRVLQIRYTMKVKFYSRLIFTYAIASAIQKGSYDLAREFVQWGKNDALKANKASSMASIDAYHAYLLILENKYEDALQIINDILENDNLSIVSYASLIASRLVSYLHYTQGDLRKSYASFVSLVANRPCTIFHNNYNSFYFVLELLGEYALAGLPPISGFEIEKELQSALTGPVKTGKGIAHCIKAKLIAQAKGWNMPEVGKHLEKSFDILQSIKAPLPLIATYWALCRHYQAVGDSDRAKKVLIDAWEIYKNSQQPKWPQDLAMPALLDATQLVLPAPNSFASFCIKLLKSRSVFANFKSIKSFFYELLSMLLSTMEMVTGEVYRITSEGRKSVAYINYGEMFKDSDSRLGHDDTLVTSVLKNRASTLYADGKLIGSDFAELSAMPDSTGLSLCLFYPHDDKVTYIFLLHGTLKVCKGNLYPQLIDILDSFISPEIDIFLQNIQIETAKIELAPSNSQLEAQEILFCSKEMSRLVEQVDSLADKTVSVLILGESGVGKELVARRLHSRSRTTGEFVPVNISNIPADLFESELFGYERGSFTGAVQKKTGLFELANNGTLFLDEIGDAPYTLQIKLLRVIQEKEFMRVGGIRNIHSNFRLVSATNKNLSRAITDGTFREDFFYRLNAVTLLVPALRERKDDIPYLAKMFRQHYSQLHGLPDRDFPESLLNKIVHFDWPGNVRQLRHFVENYCLLSTGTSACISDTLWEMGPEQVNTRPLPVSIATAGEVQAVVTSELFTELPTLKQLDEQYFEHIYAKCGGAVGGDDGIAAILGISRATAYAWIERLNLSKVYKKTVTRVG